MDSFVSQVTKMPSLFPKPQILDYSKQKEFADDNFKFNDNGRKFFKRVVALCEKDGWLVVLGFNTTLTAKIISWRSVTHMCFLAFSHQY